MSSPVEICNGALGNLGSNTISSLEEINGKMSANAKICSQFYDKARKRALRDYPWNFAQKRVSLAPIEVPAFYKDYRFAYVYPTDCLRAHQVKSSDLVKYEYILASLNDTTIILTDAEQAILFYTFDLEDSNKFDDLFEQSLEFLLGSLIALKITQKQSIKESMIRNYKAALTRARVINNREINPKIESKDSWLGART